MNSNLIVTVVCLFAAILLRAADGTVTYNNRIGGVLEAPVYGPDPADPTLALHGNDASGVPAGATVYTGTRLSGANFTAELWAMPTDGDAFSFVPGTKTTFRSAAAAGFIVPLADPEIPGVSPGLQAILQLRAWDNQGSTIVDWDTAVLMNAARGMSLSFLSDPLGGIPAVGPPISPPNLTRLSSFNIAVPEPRLAAWLSSMGALAYAGLRTRTRLKSARGNK